MPLSLAESVKRQGARRPHKTLKDIKTDIIIEEIYAMDRDPVCKRKMNRNKAFIVIDYKGENYYLCCPVCQSEFEKDPEKYLKDKRK